MSQSAVDYLLSQPHVATSPLRPTNSLAPPPAAAKPPPRHAAAAAEEHGSIMNEVFTVAWEIASGPQHAQQPHPTLVRQSSQLTDAVDWPFWQTVRRVAETCRTTGDWQRLLAVLLGISLDPFMNKSPLYSFGVAPNPAAVHGLRASRPARRRPPVAEGDSSARLASSRHTSAGERKAKRHRLRALCDGAAARHDGEQRELTLWLLGDSEAREVEMAAEREEMAEGIRAALYSAPLKGLLHGYAKERAARKGEPDSKAPLELGAEVEFEGEAEDIVRAGKGGSAAIQGGGSAGGAGGAEGGQGGKDGKGGAGVAGGAGSAAGGAGAGGAGAGAGGAGAGAGAAVGGG